MKPFNEHSPKLDTKCEINDWLCHGDVVITRIEILPEDFSSGTVEPMKALAYGEATGHLHQLQGEPGVDFDLRVNKTGERHLRIVNPTMLKHQEHSPMLLHPGVYRIGIQREYDPFEKLTRSVID